MLTLFIASSDTSLGRFNPSMLTDQARMEMLVASLEEMNDDSFDQDPLTFTTADGDYLDVCNWPGVECDHAGIVTKINWWADNWACGSVTLDYLPEQLQYFNVSRGIFDESKVSGTVQTSMLPRSLECFLVNSQELFGTLDFGGLPLPMATFEGYYNKFEGKIELERLPPKIDGIDLSGNKLCGTLCLTKLPASLRRLILDSNSFTGEIQLDSLPIGIEELDLSCNSLTGCPSVKNLPNSLTEFDLGNNDFDEDCMLVRSASQS